MKRKFEICKLKYANQNKTLKNLNNATVIEVVTLK